MPNSAVNAPAGSLSQAIATGTQYGVDVPRMFRTAERGGERTGREADHEHERNVATSRTTLRTCGAHDLIDRAAFAASVVGGERTGIEAQRKAARGEHADGPEPDRDDGERRSRRARRCGSCAPG